MWFTASLLFKGIHVNKPGSTCLWEERIVLVAADSEAEVTAIANGIGQGEQHEYCAEGEKDIVKWRFVQIERIYTIQDKSLQTGTELFSRFLRQSEVESILTPFDDS